MAKDYVHEELDREIDAISGYYVFNKEVRLPYGEREVLYLVGYAVIDKSCCGTGGCGYAFVPGYIKTWKSRSDPGGRPISEIEPIRDQSERRALTKLIEDEEIVNQVQFW